MNASISINVASSLLAASPATASLLGRARFALNSSKAKQTSSSALTIAKSKLVLKHSVTASTAVNALDPLTTSPANTAATDAR